jgi:hypothetical protein
VKIGITGTLSSGKTTLLDADHFHPHHPIHLVEEQAWTLFEHEDISPEDRLNWDTQFKLLTMIRFAEFHAEEAAAADTHPVFICDRTVADALVYAYMGSADETADRTFEGLPDQVYAEIKPWLKQYDKILVCDIAGVPFTPAPVRNEDPRFRLELHDAYLKVFEHYGIEYELLGGSEAERQARLMEIVDEAWAITGPA